jgi:predicted metal-dependent peptidase
MTEPQIPETLMAARLLCATQWPYLSAGLWALHPVERKGLGTYAVDKWWRMYFDPDLKATIDAQGNSSGWDVKGIATVLYHEINHLLRNHPERAELITELDARAWNICGDAEINDDLTNESKCKWPIEPVTPKSLKQPDNLLAEEYYANLPKVTIKVVLQDCGSCAGGPKREHELDGPAKASGTSDVPGVTAGEGDLIRQHIANEIKSSQSQGDIPDHLKRWAETFLNPRVDWRKVLRAQVKHSLADIAGKVDYTYKYPSRRAAAMPRFILPAMRAPAPKVSVVIDTSGSMGNDLLSKCVAEIGGILRACGQKDALRVFVTDATVHSAKKIWKPSQIDLMGGGGTDMRVGITAALKDKPHLIVVLTDGYTPWPESPVRAKLIVALVGEAKVETCPTYAKVVRIDDVK